jgi:hypothetical protein
MKTQDSIGNERLFIVYADAVLCFLRLSDRFECEEISFIICKEIIELLKNYILDKLYNELINCNFETNNLKNADLIKQLAPIAKELYKACNYL